MNTNLPLVLGSGSVFRQAQLQRLGVSFQTARPDFDETPIPGETAEQTALRLAVGKARSLAGRFPQALIIGADQVAWCNGLQLSKPMSVANAQQMLAQSSGQRIVFYSALCLLNTASGGLHTHVDKTVVTMRKLGSGQIRRYLEHEPDAVYCAGAAKSEGLGAALLERIDSTDPNALIGLPVFKLVEFLAAEGVAVV
ncbi:MULTISPECIES: nucleoside triphosphate pyrophosphatase [unclassified Neisseria]|uniref:Maf family protein n=1 Tax=unclassified Neisseria TaxID=2623750 RepID=UPI001071A658|nr:MULTISPECIES: nucleoside triphosphate pyrophosphatase [unclassified Neisseria]MBF0803795.1 septum formation protein Maf [Neisseria sp. 19428wB4_WF04]TFU43469.1 septum formation protein Maf [Neisseria sp. WF04]